MKEIEFFQAEFHGFPVDGHFSAGSVEGEGADFNRFAIFFDDGFFTERRADPGHEFSRAITKSGGGIPARRIGLVEDPPAISASVSIKAPMGVLS